MKHIKVFISKVIHSYLSTTLTLSAKIIVFIRETMSPIDFICLTVCVCCFKMDTVIFLPSNEAYVMVALDIASAADRNQRVAYNKSPPRGFET